MSTECQKHRERFSEYLDGELGEAERAALEAHLEDCALCRAELDMWQRTVRAVSELPFRNAPEGFAGRVFERVRGQRIVPGRRKLVVLWTRVLPVAAMFLVVVGLTLMLNREALLKHAEEPEPLAMAEPEEIPAGGFGTRALESAPAVDEEGAAAGEALGRFYLRDELLGTELDEARRAEAALGERTRLSAGGGGRAAVPPAHAAASEETAAFAWRGTEGATGELEAPGRKQANLVFQQVAAEPPLLRRPPQQVLTLIGEDPTGLLLRTVVTANRYGLPASFEVVEGDGMNVYLEAPQDGYDGLLRELAGLAAPQSQALSNTLHAKDDYFQAVLIDYENRRNEALEELRGLMRAREPGRALGVLDQPRAVPAEDARTDEKAEAEEAAPKEVDKLAMPIMLQIVISRPARETQ